MKTIAALMPTIIGIVAIALILFLAIRYIYKEKKKGNHCIGCPYSDTCPKHHAGASCSGNDPEVKA